MTKDRVWKIILSSIGGVLGAMGLYLYQAYKRARVYRLQQLQSEIHIFHANNGIIEYQCVGSGKPVLVFHGLLGSYEHGRNAMWQFDLSQYQLITISRIGYTLTCDQSHTSLTQQADAIAELLTHLNIDECTVIAMSAEVLRGSSLPRAILKKLAD